MRVDRRVFSVINKHILQTDRLQSRLVRFRRRRCRSCDVVASVDDVIGFRRRRRRRVETGEDVLEVLGGYDDAVQDQFG